MEIIGKFNGFMGSAYEPSNKMIYTFHEGIPECAKIVVGWKTILNFLESHPADYMFTNSSGVKDIFSDSNLFLKNVVVPFFSKHNLKYYPIAMTSDVFTLYAMNNLLKFMDRSFEMRIFKNPQVAKEWLESKTGKGLNIPQEYSK